MTYERELHGVTFDPRSHESIFFSKFQDWGYEKEIRVVLPLSKCQIHSNGSKPLYLYELPRSCVRQIIIGWHADPKTIRIIETYVRELGHEVEIVLARIARGRVELIPQRKIDA